MIKVAEEEKPDIVCVSGDVFHQEQIGPVRYSDEMIVATDTITKLAGVAKAVIVMRGTPRWTIQSFEQDVCKYRKCTYSNIANCTPYAIC